MTEAQVVVSGQALNDAASDTTAIAGQIDQQLGDLKGYLAPLVSSWEGAAASDWQALQQKWNSSAEDLHAVLQQIAGALTTAAENYSSGERANAAMWQA